MKRKCIFALLIGAFLLCLCACGKEPPTAALCFRQTTDGAYTAYYKTLEDTLRNAGFQVTVADAADDQSKQTAQIDGFAAEKYDLLIVEPVITASGAELVEQVKAANIPTVFVNREPEAEALALWTQVSYVGCDTSKAGILQGQIILQTPDKGDINGDGVVSYIVISGPEDHLDAQSRTQGCTQLLTDAGVQLSLLSTGCGDWTEDSGHRLCEQALARYGKDIEVIFCNNDAMALGAMAAIEAGGRTVGQDVYLVGIDALPRALTAVQSSTLTGTVSTNMQAQADQILTVCRALLDAQPVEKQYYIDYAPVFPENVEVFLPE